MEPWFFLCTRGSVSLDSLDQRIQFSWIIPQTKSAVSLEQRIKFFWTLLYAAVVNSTQNDTKCKRIKFLWILWSRGEFYAHAALCHSTIQEFSFRELFRRRRARCHSSQQLCFSEFYVALCHSSHLIQEFSFRELFRRRRARCHSSQQLSISEFYSSYAAVVNSPQTRRCVARLNWSKNSVFVNYSADEERGVTRANNLVFVYYSADKKGSVKFLFAFC
jgi:hypothetical protein